MHRRRILKVKMTTDEHIEAHETTPPPNPFPHPPPPHVHSEIWRIREATVETIQGATHRLVPGRLGLVRSNEEHGINNLGLGPVTLFVIAVATGAAV